MPQACFPVEMKCFALLRSSKAAMPYSFGRFRLNVRLSGITMIAICLGYNGNIAAEKQPPECARKFDGVVCGHEYSGTVCLQFHAPTRAER